MSEITPRAELVLPGGGSTGLIQPDEVADIDVLNSNFRKIDALLGARSVPSASSYGGSMDGDLVFTEDTEYLHMYSADAGELIIPRHPGAHFYTGTIAQRDAATSSGMIQDGDHWQVTGEANAADNSEYVRLSGSWRLWTSPVQQLSGAGAFSNATFEIQVSNGCGKLYGVITRNSGNIGGSEKMADIPEEFRPISRNRPLLAVGSGTTVHKLSLNSAGALSVVALGGTTTNVVLNGLSYTIYDI